MRSSVKLYFAPFQGITNSIFRSVYARHLQGIDAFFTPFFLSISNENKLPQKKAIELEAIKENGVEIIPQILSKDADEIIRFAKYCEAKGFKEINWNLGCPYPQVANKKRGSGLLPYPFEVEKILTKVTTEVSIRFSIKCRLGYETKDEIFELVPIFNRSGISEVTIHPRLGKQLYTGVPDRNEFKNIFQHFTLPVVYNGDVFTLMDYQKFNKEFPLVNTIMLGRGLLSNPFLAAEIKGIPVEMERRKLVEKFMLDLYLTYRKKMNDRLSVLSVLKEYWEHLALSFDDPHLVFKSIKKTKTFDEYETIQAKIFREFSWVKNDF